MSGAASALSHHDTDVCANAWDLYAAPAGQKCKVQLLKPSAVLSRRSYSAPVTPPIGAAYLAATLERAGYSVGLIDAVGEAITQVTPSPCGTYNIQGLSAREILERIDPDAMVLGISLMFSQEWLIHRELIQAIRRERPRLIIVVGGEHPTAMPDYVLNDCAAIDYLIAGEGELAFLELIHALLSGDNPRAVSGVWYRDEQGVPCRSGAPKRMSVIQHLPRPAWHLVPVRNYFLDNWTTGISMGRNMPIIASRGCPYQCTFCSSPTMWTTRYVMRTAESVVDEIEWLISEYGANSIDFQDLTAIIKKPWILEFCQELERRGVNITWQLPSGTRSEALDAEVLAAMKRTGCHLIVYAPESGSTETLKAIKKRVDLDRITASMREAVTLNMVVKVNLVIGFPDERPINIFKTLAFGIRMAFLGANDVNIAIFSPYPGSELYRELLASGVLPQPTDDYFRNLLSQFELVSPITFCRRMPTWTIVPIRLAGFALFYCLAYLLHPSRMLRVARATLSNSFRPGNLFEQRMSDLFARRRIHTNI